MLHVIELIAVITCAIYGGLRARHAGMDFIGVFTLAFVVALGGGTLRDVLLARYPIFWIRHETYPIVIFGIALALALPLRLRLPARMIGVLTIPDAMGLGLFSVAGASYALEQGTSMFIASLMGVVTGCAGGVLSDVICNEVPRLFRPSPLYATCSFVGCWVFMGLRPLSLPDGAAMWAAIVLIVLLRLAAVRWNWHLPTYDHSGADSA